MAADNENNTGFVLAALGGGAVLLWLLWRGRGARQAGDGTGDRSAARPEVVVWICGGDRVKVDGVSVDLATAVDHARRAGRAAVFATGEARHGWVEDVERALSTSGVSVRLGPVGHQAS